MPDFVVKTASGAELELGPRICFAPLWYFNSEQQAQAHTLSYNPRLQVNQSIALRYLTELKKIPFHIPQTAEELLKDGYHVKFEDFRKKAGHISIVELVGTLVAIRYIEECMPIVHKFLNLIDLYPEIDRWKALYTAGFVKRVSGELPIFGEVNGNHTLGTEWGPVTPFKSWDKIQETFESAETAWTDKPPGLQKHFGVRGGLRPKINEINTKEDFQKFEAECSKPIVVTPK